MQTDLTLRDYFAAQVIGPLMGSDGFESQILQLKGVSLEDLPRFAAQTAYEIADAMLLQRSKQSPSVPSV